MVDLRVEQLLAQIRSGINIDEIAFTEGNITFWKLQNIDQNTNPVFHTESSQHADDNYEPPCLEDFNSQEEVGGKEEISLPIPGPSGTHTRKPHSEHKWITGETPWNNSRGNVPTEDHTRVRVTLEWPPWVNLACEKCPRVPTAQPVWTNTMEEHRQNLLDGVVDTRTKLLNFYFFLIYIQTLLLFLTYIRFLCAL